MRVKSKRPSEKHTKKCNVKGKEINVCGIVFIDKFFKFAFTAVCLTDIYISNFKYEYNF